MTKAQDGAVTDDHDLLLRLDGDVRVLSATVQSLNDSIMDRLDARDKAVELQADEYERRLENLNHEAQRIAADKATYASNERLDGVIREMRASFENPIKQNAEHIAALELSALKASAYETAHAALSDRVVLLETFRARAMGFGTLLALLAGAVGAAIGRAVG